MLLFAKRGLPGSALLLLSVSPSLAATNTVDSGHVAWVLTASALVLFMTLPGHGLFYGGLVQARNVLVLMHHLAAISQPPEDLGNVKDL